MIKYDYLELGKRKTKLVDIRNRTLLAREAAILIYKGLAQEYKQAKIMTAKNFGTKKFPGNYEVAIELDEIADEIEGASRKESIVRMRKQALELMNTLNEFNPRLIGSVWRGTVRNHSDLDITVYASDSNDVIRALESKNYEINDAKWIRVNLENTIRPFLNIRVLLNNGKEAEITVREIDDQRVVEKCEIYGDYKMGLSIGQLKKVLKVDPLKKFIPLRKSKTKHQ